MPKEKFDLKKQVSGGGDSKPELDPPVEYDQIKSLRKTNFRNLVLQRDRARADKKSSIDAVKALDEQLLPLVRDAGEKRILVDDIRLTLCKGRSVVIDKKKLLLAGVDIDVILACTVVKEYDYIQTKPVAEGDDDD